MAVPWHERAQSRQGTLSERTNAAVIISPSRRGRRRLGLGAGGVSASVAPEVPEERGALGLRARFGNKPGGGLIPNIQQSGRKTRPICRGAAAISATISGLESRCCN